MSVGTPLTDEDRLPWLKIIRARAEHECKDQWETGTVSPECGRPVVVIACSALKKSYRDILRGDAEGQSSAPVSTTKR